jgi:hypothetical protein
VHFIEDGVEKPLKVRADEVDVMKADPEPLMADTLDQLPARHASDPEFSPRFLWSTQRTHVRQQVPVIPLIVCIDDLRESFFVEQRMLVQLVR